MYVAITRAEKALFLTESEGFNVSTKMNKYPSRFLAEIKRETLVTEGYIPEDLWRGTRNLIHVLDEEQYAPAASGDDGFAAERAAYESPFRVGTAVTHPVFGEGIIRDVGKVTGKGVWESEEAVLMRIHVGKYSGWNCANAV